MNSIDATAELASRPQERTARRWGWSHIVCALAGLATGIALGVGGAALYLERTFDHERRHPEEIPARIARELRSRLRLSDAQAERVEAILAAQRPQWEALRREMHPRAEALFHDVEQQIGELLDESQVEAWQAWVAEVRERRFPPPPPAAPAGGTDSREASP